MVVIDFSHLSFRMLHTAIFLTKPKKRNGQFITEDFENMYKHLIFKSLLYIRKSHKDKDILIALDSKNNWRKNFYPEYKSNRKKGREKSEINFDEFFEVLDNVIEELKNFPFKTVKLNYLEADDIASILVQKYPEKNKILITSDKDWKQLLINSNTKMYDPIKKEFQKLSKEEAEIIEIPELGLKKSRYVLKHILLGDAVDNIPGVVKNTKFSDNFKKYLKELNLNLTEEEFWDLNEEKRNNLIDNYNVFKVIKSGKRKGEFSDEKDIFKTVPFGEKKALKVLESKDTLLDFLNSNNLYLKNFKRNLILIDMSYVPEELSEQVLNFINNYKITYNSNEIKNFFIKNGLNDLLSDLHLFIDNRYENKAELIFDSRAKYEVQNDFTLNENNVKIEDDEFDF